MVLFWEGKEKNRFIYRQHELGIAADFWVLEQISGTGERHTTCSPQKNRINYLSRAYPGLYWVISSLYRTVGLFYVDLRSPEDTFIKTLAAILRRRDFLGVIRNFRTTWAARLPQHLKWSCHIFFFAQIKLIWQLVAFSRIPFVSILICSSPMKLHCYNNVYVIQCITYTLSTDRYNVNFYLLLITIKIHGFPKE